MSTLCDDCKVTPWGEEGWKDLYSRETFRTNLKWADDSDDLQRAVCYNVKPEQFYRNADRCAWCSLLRDGFGLPPRWEQIEPHGFTDLSMSMSFLAATGVVPDRINLIMVSCLAGTEKGFTPFSCRLSIFSEPDGPASSVFLSPHVSHHNGADFDHKLAREWIDTCAQRHQGCKSQEQIPVLPTRVLEITANADSEALPMAFLRESEPEERHEYICLSYKWGQERTHDFAELAQAAHNTVTEPDSLPAVFRDAIYVAHRLRIRYLWIDALCIWQDDPDDLKHELSMMHRYYSEATAVVQTSGTDSVDESFLGTARNSVVANMINNAVSVDVDSTFIKVPFRSDNKEDKEEVDAVYISLSKDVPSYNENDEPATSRGWIFQEQNLCRRLLIFPSGGGMIFRCDSNLWGTHDGSVNYHIEGPFRPPLRPPWGKERLMTTDEFPGDVVYIPFQGRMRSQFNQMRRLAAMGSRPEIVLVGSSVILTLNVTDEDRAKREERNREKRKGQTTKLLEDEQETTGEQLEKAEEEGEVREEHEGGKEVAGEEPVGHQVSKTSISSRPSSTEPDDLVETRFEAAALKLHMELADGTTKINTIPPTEHPFLRMSRGDRSMLIATDPLPGTVFPEGVSAAWKRLVTDYCKRKLTNPMDKLVAMAALARSYSDRYGEAVLGTYHAGLWSNFAGEELLWYVDRRGRPQRTTTTIGRDRAYLGDTRAPSWSWAVVEGARYTEPELMVENGVDYMKELDAKVVRCETTPAEESPPLGAVTAGCMELSGKVLNVWWGPDVDKDGHDSIGLFTSQHDHESVGSYLRVWADDADIRLAGREALRMLMVRRFIHGVGHNDDHEAECLLLRKAHKGGDNGYIRVGFASMVFKKFDRDFGPRFREEIMVLY